MSPPVKERSTGAHRTRPCESSERYKSQSDPGVNWQGRFNVLNALPPPLVPCRALLGRPGLATQQQCLLFCPLQQRACRKQRRERHWQRGGRAPPTLLFPECRAAVTLGVGLLFLHGGNRNYMVATGRIRSSQSITLQAPARACANGDLGSEKLVQAGT